MRFRDVKAGTRLGGGFGVIMLIFAASVIFSTVSLRVIKRDATQVSHESLPYMQAANEMELAATKISESLTDVSATHDKEGFKDAERYAQKFTADLAKFKEMFERENDAQGQKDVEEIGRTFGNYYENGKKMAKVYVAQGMEAGNKLMEGFDATRVTLLKEVNTLEQTQSTEATHDAATVVRRA